LIGIPNSDSELVSWLKPHRSAFFRAFWLSLITSLLVLAPILYMFEVYGRVVDSGSITTLLVLTLLVVWVYIVMEVAEWARVEIMRTEAVKFEIAISERIFKAMIDLNKEKGTSGFIQPISDLRTIKEFFFSPALMAILESPSSIFFLVFIFLISPLLGAIALIAAILQVFLGLFNDRQSQVRLKEANKIGVDSQQYADHALKNIHVIEALGLQNNVREKWRQKQVESTALQSSASENAGFYQAVTKLLQMTLSSGLLGLSAWLLLKDELLGGPAMMIVASTLGARVLAPFAQALGNWRVISSFRSAIARVDDILQRFPPKEIGMPLPRPLGHLSVEALSVTVHGQTKPVLRGIEFSLNPGEALAIMGPSASGKTSLVRALAGIWPPATGKVRLDGADVYLWNKDELGPSIGYLPQTIELFDGTIAENISRFGTIDLIEVERLSVQLGISETISSSDMGYSTTIGNNISGGIRQRIGIARAFYGHPSFIILDEPNSNLDAEGDALLTQLILNEKKSGSTIIIVTHRPSVLEAVDKIIILNEGVQQAFGSKEEIFESIRKVRYESKKKN
jgi:ATP-binding cassette subfamily C exporter for protease/lipase